MIAYLKKEDAGKEKNLEDLKRQVRDLRTEAHRDKETLMENYSHQIAQLETAVSDKDDEVTDDLGMVKWIHRTIRCI